MAFHRKKYSYRNKALRTAGLTALGAFVMLVLTACPAMLKTRSQLKEEPQAAEGEGPSKPVAAQGPEEVQGEEGYVVDELKSEITRLTGRIEDLERAQKQQQASATAKDATQEELKKLEQRIIELERAQAAMLEAIKKMETNAPIADQVELFEKGRGQLKASQYEDAIDSFSGYLKNPKGKHVEEATYLRAEAYFLSKQYKKAILDYSKFPEKFTKSKRLPNALLKIAQSFEAIGMKDDAKGFYQELVDKFPKSPEAKKAKAKVK